ncbi:MAG: glycine cleavage system protein R [Desulfobulbia bacterium]
MVSEIVFTVVAEDRPGLVASISEVVSRHSGNWVDSSMAHLKGEFAGIICAEIPSPNLSEFKSDLVALGDDNIEIQIRNNNEQDSVFDGGQATFEVTGADHPGIVHEVSRVLAQLEVNIEMLQTEVYSASMSGNQMFRARVKIFYPANIEISEIINALEDIANDIMVDIAVADHP